MTTWIIGVIRPTAGQTVVKAGFGGAYEDTGLRYDDSKTVTSWTPAVASTKSIQVQKILAHLTAGQEGMEGALGAGWLYVADNQAGLIVFPNRDPL